MKSIKVKSAESSFPMSLEAELTLEFSEVFVWGNYNDIIVIMHILPFFKRGLDIFVMAQRTTLVK